MYKFDDPTDFIINTTKDLQEKLENRFNKDKKNEIIKRNEKFFIVILNSSNEHLIKVDEIQSHALNKGITLLFFLKIKNTYLCLHQVGYENLISITNVIAINSKRATHLYIGRHGGFRQNWETKNQYKYQKTEEDTPDRVNEELIDVIKATYTAATCQNPNRTQEEEIRNATKTSSEHRENGITKLYSVNTTKIKYEHAITLFDIGGANNHTDGIIKTLKDDDKNNVATVLFWCFSACFMYTFDNDANFIKGRVAGWRSCFEETKKKNSTPEKPINLKHVDDDKEYLIVEDKCADIYNKTINDLATDLRDKLGWHNQ